MKKLLLVLAVAAFVACNDSGTTEETTPTDSPATQPTTPAPGQDTATTGSDTARADTSAIQK